MGRRCRGDRTSSYCARVGGEALAPRPTTTLVLQEKAMRAALGVLVSAVIVCGCAPAIAPAQNPAPAAAQLPPLSNQAQILPASRLAAISDSLPPGASRTLQLGRFEGLTNAVTTRDSSGIHERHEFFTDIFVVQKGSARLLTGGTVDGQKETSPGEWRGGTIRGGTTTELHPGDVVVIPAGIPHQMLLNPGERIAYLAFKVAKKAGP
jgi:mannose-6-phosphate isomerase-like protein (cupin superfamily)